MCNICRCFDLYHIHLIAFYSILSINLNLTITTYSYKFKPLRKKYNVKIYIIFHATNNIYILPRYSHDTYD